MALTMKKGEDRHCWPQVPPLEGAKFMMVLLTAQDRRPEGREEKTLRCRR